MANSEWTGEDFTKAIDDIQNGRILTSAQYNSLVAALNQRITSGLGDMTWRTLWMLNTLVGDFSQRTILNFYSFPRSDEWWSHHLFLDHFENEPQHYPQNPLWVFRDGWPDDSIRGEKDRLGTMKVDSGTAKQVWDRMKPKRGRITTQHAIDRDAGCRVATDTDGDYTVLVKDVDLWGFERDTICYNAREILQLPRRISGYYNRLKTYGGRIVPTEAGTIQCDNNPQRPDPETPTGDPGTDPDNPGVPTPAPIPPINEGDPDDGDPENIQGDYKGDYLASIPAANSQAWDWFTHERGAQYEMIMTAYLAEFRGTSSANDNSVYNIRETAFDFDRFFRSQYLFAPARSDSYYPSLTTTFAEAHEKFVIAGVMIHGDVSEPTVISMTIEDENGVQHATSLLLDEDNSSDSRYFPSGSIRKIRLVEDLPSGISAEYYEAFKMLPKIYDAYALLRVRNIVGGTSADKRSSDDYFQHGALFGGEFADAEEADPLSNFPPYHSIRRFIKSLARVHSYDRLVGYEVIVEDGEQKSVLYYERDAWQIIDGDMWDNMIHKRKSEASAGGVSEEWVWQIGGSCSASSSNAASARIFKEQAYAQIRGAFANPMFAFDSCLQAPSYRGYWESPSLWTRQRRRNMAFLFRGVPRDDLGIGRYMPWAEAPSGLNYRYETDPTTQNMGSEDAKSYYRSNQIFQAPYIVDSIDYITATEFAEKFPNGAVSGSNARNYIQRGSVSVDKVVKVVLKSRLRRTSTAPATVNNTGASWNSYSTTDRWPAERSKTVGGVMTFIGERSDENRIVELVRHRWQCSAENPPRRLGDVAPSLATEPDIPLTELLNIWGNVFCRTFFMKLLPKAYEDGNNAWNSTDTSIFSHLFRHAEMIIRASCGAFFDVEANRDNMEKVGSGRNTQCVYNTPPRDFSMEALASRADPADAAVENLPIRYIEDDSVENRRIDGFGPVPNIDFTSGLFNQFSRCINLMIGCTIPGHLGKLQDRISAAVDEPATETFTTRGDAWNVALVTGEGGSPNSPWYYFPIRGPFNIENPGTPAGLLSDWQDAGSENSFTATRMYRVRGDEANFRYLIEGSSSLSEWRVIGTEEFMEAFNPLIRAYLIRNSLGRPFVEIIIPSQSTEWSSESRTYANGQTLTIAVFTPVDPPTPIVGECEIRQGGSPHAPALHRSASAVSNEPGRQRIGRAAETYYAEGGRSSSTIHNVTAASDATLIINTEGQTIGGVKCEETASGLLIPFQWYEVMGGAGIYYAKDDLTSAPRNREDHPEDYNLWGDGSIFFGVRYGTNLGGYTPVRDYEQVNPADPSRICIRRDLGTAPIE